MSLLDRIRTEIAVVRYDLWLDLRGVTGGRRRELRRELRANLADAAAERGSRAAVERLGSLRHMAAQAAPVDPTRPRWSVGLGAALALVLLTVLAELWSAMAWADGVLATAPAVAVSGSMTLFPGSEVSYAPSAAGFEVGFSPGWTSLAVGLLAFLLVARPWRLLAHRDRRLSA